MTVDQLFDSIAVRLRSEDVGGLAATVNVTVTDLDERWVLALSNRTIHHVAGRHHDGADATIALAKEVLVAVTSGERTVDDAVAAGDAVLDGDASAIGRILDHLDTFLSNFAIVEP